jgi:hypothetical protein
MCTSKASEKMWWVRGGEPSVQAAIACGFEKELSYSLQMRGRLEVFNPESNPHAANEYAGRASQLDIINDPENAMVVFIPSWARYTDRANGYITHQITL